MGVDVDPLLTALYSEPGDQGAVGTGSVRLAIGQWPATAEMRDAVGDGLDLFVSKNTLKNGYIHPEEVDPRMLVHLDVDDETYCRTVFDALKPGGYFLIYNLCPAPAAPGEKYIPWADGRSLFSRATFEKVGFRVLAIDVDDNAAARAMGELSSNIRSAVLFRIVGIYR